MSAEHTPRQPGKPWTFLSDVKCCTFFPDLPNFLVGRGLGRGGVSEELLRARIAVGVGRTPLGLQPDPVFEEAYFKNTGEVFGKDRSLACPYWVGGEYSCGIWHDRNHVCRTWFCKNSGGAEGRQHWGATQRVLSMAEHLLAAWCVRDGVPPPEAASAAAWESWYRWCAKRVEHVPAPVLGMLREQEGVQGRVDQLAHYPYPEARVLPDVLVPSLSLAEPDGPLMYVAGYSSYDGVHTPDSLFQFLSRLDGQRTWQEVNGALEVEGFQVLPRSVLEELHRVGAVRYPQPGDLRGTEAGYERMEGGMYLRLVEES